MQEKKRAHLIKQKANVNSADKNGNTPLHKAVENFNLKTAQLLIERGANVNAVDKNGSTPLHKAFEWSSGEIAKLLIEKGADINAVDKKGNTPLHTVLKKGANGFFIETIELMIKKEADVTTENQNGKTPLKMIFDNKQFSWKKRAKILGSVPPGKINERVASSIITKAIHSFAKGKRSNKTKGEILACLTILDSKIPPGNETVVQILIRKDRHKALLKDVLNYALDANKPGKNNKTPVYTAAQRKNIKALTLLKATGGQGTNETLDFTLKNKHDTLILDGMLFLKLLEMGANPFTGKWNAEQIRAMLEQNKSLYPLLKEPLQEAYLNRIVSSQKGKNSFTNEKILTAYEKGQNQEEIRYKTLQPSFNKDYRRSYNIAVSQILAHPNNVSALMSTQADRGIRNGINRKEAQDPAQPFFDTSHLPNEIRNYITSFIIKNSTSIQKSILSHTINTWTEKLSDHYQKKETRGKKTEKDKGKKDSNKNFSRT